MYIVAADETLSNIAVKDSIGFGVDEQIVEQLSETKDRKAAVV
ncbi:hypothetical protein [Sphingobacterium sp. SYP-B4668]|nr:hypothetical protein [Sphingobacterium sp. SYP-B4668]